MNSSNPNMTQAESLKPSMSKLEFQKLSPKQQMDWFAQAAVDALNSLAAKARAKEAQAPNQAT
jgi:hypothetical protein